MRPFPALCATFVAGICSVALSPTAFASPTWPTQTVRLIVPYPAGGGIDVLARAVAQPLAGVWGRAIVVENRPGANTLIGTEAVARATDDHTLLFTTDATFTVNPHVYAQLPYDGEKDFAPITKLASFDQMLVAHHTFPAQNVEQMLELAVQKPGELSYASYGPGSQPHLASEVLKHRAEVDILHVPYRGVPQALNAVLAGETELTWSGIASAGPHIDSGAIKPLGFAGPSRSPLYPNVPTLSEIGYPEVDANVWIGVFAPASMPRDVVTRIDADLQKVLADPELRQRHITERGFEVEGQSLEAFGAFIQEQAATRAEAVRISGAKSE